MAIAEVEDLLVSPEIKIRRKIALRDILRRALNRQRIHHPQAEAGLKERPSSKECPGYAGPTPPLDAMPGRSP